MELFDSTVITKVRPGYIYKSVKFSVSKERKRDKKEVFRGFHTFGIKFSLFENSPLVISVVQKMSRLVNDTTYKPSFTSMMLGRLESRGSTVIAEYLQGKTKRGC